MDRVEDARRYMRSATREAYSAWNLYAKMYADEGWHHHAARAQGATHLPEDVRDLLGIDRYGSKVR
jgi:hypothetical protein